MEPQFQGESRGALYTIFEITKFVHPINNLILSIVISQNNSHFALDAFKRVNFRNFSDTLLLVIGQKIG